MRQIEIIGEAARNVSDEFREANSSLPWSQMIAMRNKVIHDYIEVNFDVVWGTAQDDLPPLRRQIEAVLS